jgi:hypothetical protein
MYIDLRVKYPLFLLILIKFEFSRQVFRKYSNFMKIRPVGAKFFHADGRMDGRTERQTDMTKLMVGFRNFAMARKNLYRE